MSSIYFKLEYLSSIKSCLPPPLCEREQAACQICIQLARAVPLQPACSAVFCHPGGWDVRAAAPISCSPPHAGEWVLSFTIPFQHTCHMYPGHYGRVSIHNPQPRPQQSALYIFIHATLAPEPPTSWSGCGCGYIWDVAMVTVCAAAWCRGRGRNPCPANSGHRRRASRGEKLGWLVLFNYADSYTVLRLSFSCALLY